MFAVFTHFFLNSFCFFNGWYLLAKNRNTSVMRKKLLLDRQKAINFKEKLSESYFFGLFDDWIQPALLWINFSCCFVRKLLICKLIGSYFLPLIFQMEACVAVEREIDKVCLNLKKNFLSQEFDKKDSLFLIRPTSVALSSNLAFLRKTRMSSLEDTVKSLLQCMGISFGDQKCERKANRFFCYA